MLKKFGRWALGAMLGSGLMIGSAAAQGYPEQPIKIVVPFAAGGASDVLARIIADTMSQSIGEQVIVDNKPGASTTIGNSTVAQAAADGYTLLFAVTPFVLSQVLMDELPYDPAKDFIPMSLIAISPQVLVVNASVEAETLDELIALAKSDPGALTIASAGNGSLTHLAAELFKLEAGLDLLHVPYAGGGPATISVLSGETDMQFAAPSDVVQHLESGALRVIAAASDERVGILPDVPTFEELGYPGIKATSFFAMMVPAGTPGDVVDKLVAELKTTMTNPDLVERFSTLGAYPRGTDPEHVAAFLAGELERWKKVVSTAGITLE